MLRAILIFSAFSRYVSLSPMAPLDTLMPPRDV